MGFWYLCFLLALLPLEGLPSPTYIWWILVYHIIFHIVMLKTSARFLHRYIDPWNAVRHRHKSMHLWTPDFLKRFKKNYTLGKDSILNKWCSLNWMSVCRTIQINAYLSSWTKLKTTPVQFMELRAVELVST